jgi:hypothetical protein
MREIGDDVTFPTIAIYASLLVAATAATVAMNSVVAENQIRHDQITQDQSNRADPQTQSKPEGTGPLNTESGGTPPASPQGDAPPGMQSKPQESPEKAPPK